MMNLISKTKCRLFGLKVLGVIVMLSVSLLYSCKDDDKETPAPSLSLASEATSDKAGAVVSTTFEISAPAGLKSLVILKNGAALETKTFNNETSITDTFEYTVEALTVGTAVNFTFQAIDSKNQSSEIKTYVVTVSSKPIKDIPAGNYVGSITWDSDTTYRIAGFVRIGRDDKNEDGTFTNATGELTIEAGTLIVGKLGTKGTLIIQRGSKIYAIGTANNPIVFTSEAAPGTKLPGDWGGLVICGKATNNQGTNVQLEGAYGGWHGGGVDDDNSGELKYVRIEYAGVPINPNQEVNSLTMGSVGSGTKISYIQCSYGLDDAYEWFGGKVNCKYLIAYRGSDDDFDVDYGYSGSVQFALGIRDLTYADQSGSNGFEVDNDGSGTDAQPYTSAVFSNVTIIGPKKLRESQINTDFQHCAHLRRNNKLKIYNSFFTGYPWGMYIDGSATSTNATNDDLQLRNVIVAGVKDWGGNGFGSVYDAGTEGTVTGLPFGANAQHPTAPRGISLLKNTTTFDIVAWFNTAAYRNMRYAGWDEAGIPSAIFDLGTPSFLLPSTSVLKDYAKWDNTPAATSSLDQTVPYIGAFGTTTDWTTGWTEWNPQAKQY